MPSGELPGVDVKYWNAKERHAIAWRSLYFLGVAMETEIEEAGGQAQGQPVQMSGYFPLIEKALRRDGTVGLRLIGPGWGSSGFYPVETLRRDGPLTFKAGTKMYWNHPTMSQESERPEGDLRDLAAVLVSDARWEEAGQAGPGLYADAKVFGDYARAVEELAPHIGVSIRASGRAMSGEAEGRQGSIINAITAARSVDFVTEPGAGGRVVEMFEAARPGADERRQTKDEAPLQEARNVAEWFEARLHNDFTVRADEMFGEGYLSREERIILSSAIGDALNAFRVKVEAEAPGLYQRDIFAQASGNNALLSVGESTPKSGGGNVDELEKAKADLEKAKADLAEALDEVAALKAEAARLAEALLVQSAQAVVREALGQVDLPGVAMARLLRSVPVNAPVVDGKLDEAGLRQRVAEAVAAESAYLQEAAGWGQGRIEGMGGASTGNAGGVDMAVVEKRLNGAFAALGFAAIKEG